MMRQANDSQFQQQQQNLLSVAPAPRISNNNRSKELQDRTADALLKGQPKKDLLVRVKNSKTSILQLASEADESYTNTDLNEQLGNHFKVGNVLHSNNSINNKADNKKLAETIVGLFDPFQLLLDYYDKENTSQGVSTRSARAEPSHITLMREFMTLRENVDARILTKASNTTNNPLLKGLPLTPQQKSRKFIPSLIPNDSAYHNCPFCNHASINEDPDNALYEQRNRAKKKIYDERMNVWTPYKTAKDAWEKSQGGGDPEPQAPRDPHGSKDIMNKKPRAPKYDDAALQCMCSTSFCLQEGSDVGSSCFLYCRVIPDEEGTGGVHPSLIASTIRERHPFTTSGSRRKCSCSICTCICSKRFAKKDLQAIASAKAVAAHQELHQPQQSGEHQTANFLQNVFRNGAMGANAALQSSRGLVQGSNDQGAVVDHFYNSAAVAAARIGANAFNTEGMRTLRDNLGRSTVVNLPGGHEFDTRSISANKNAHQKNNRLPGLPRMAEEEGASSGAANQPLPGMLDRINPDYSNMTQEFIQAGRSGNLASQLIQGAIGGGSSQTAAGAAAAHPPTFNQQRPSSFNPSDYVPNGLSEEDQIQALMAGGMSKDTKQSMMNAAPTSEEWMKNIDDGTYLDDGTYMDEDGTLHIDSPQRKMPPQRNMPPPIPPQQRNMPFQRPPPVQPPGAPLRTPADSGTTVNEDETPAVIVNTRTELRKSRRSEKNPKRKKRIAQSLQHLTRPYNQVVYDEVLDTEDDMETPERADNVVGLVEDLEISNENE